MESHESSSKDILDAVLNLKEKKKKAMKMINDPNTTVKTLENAIDEKTGNGILHIVTKAGDVEILRSLLDRGMDAHRENNEGKTPFVLAITESKRKARKCAGMLLEYDSRVIDWREERDGQELNILHLMFADSERSCYPSVIEVIGERCGTKLFQLIDEKVSVEIGNEKKLLRAIELAVINGADKCLIKFLEMGEPQMRRTKKMEVKSKIQGLIQCYQVKPNKKKLENCQRAYAIITFYTCDDIQWKDLRLDLTFYPDLYLFIHPETKQTCLHVLCKSCKSLPKIKLIVESGADLDALDCSNMTPLSYVVETASEAQKQPVLTMLLDFGASIVPHENENVFERAIKSGDTDVMKLLYARYKTDCRKTLDDMVSKEDDYRKEGMDSVAANLNGFLSSLPRDDLDQLANVVEFGDAIEDNRPPARNPQRRFRTTHPTEKPEETIHELSHGSNKATDQRLSLHEICSEGFSCEMARTLLLEKSADVNAMNDRGETPLDCVVRSNGKAKYDILELLLIRRADVDIGEARVLKLALKNGDAKAVRMIGSYSEKEPFQTRLRDFVKSDLFLMEIICKGNVAMLGLLDQQQVLKNELKKQLERLVEYSQYMPHSREEIEAGWKGTAIHLCCLLKNQSMVKCLKRMGLDVSLLDSDGTTARQAIEEFDSHVKAQSQNEYFDIMSMSADDIMGVDEQGRNRLHRVCRDGKSTPVVSLLIQRGARINQLDDQQKTPLHHLVDSKGPNRLPMMRELLQYGADMRQGVPNAFNYALRNGKIDVVNEIYKFDRSILNNDYLDSDAFKLDLRDMIANGYTEVVGFLYARNHSSTKSLHKLIEYPEQVRKGAKSAQGNGLHIACLSKTPEMVHLLLDYDFSLVYQDKTTEERNEKDNTRSSDVKLNGDPEYAKDSNGETTADLIKGNDFDDQTKHMLENRIENKETQDKTKEELQKAQNDTHAMLVDLGKENRSFYDTIKEKLDLLETGSETTGNQIHDLKKSIDEWRGKTEANANDIQEKVDEIGRLAHFAIHSDISVSEEYLFFCITDEIVKYFAYKDEKIVDKFVSTLLKDYSEPKPGDFHKLIPYQLSNKTANLNAHMRLWKLLTWNESLHEKIERLKAVLEQCDCGKLKDDIQKLVNDQPNLLYLGQIVKPSDASLRELSDMLGKDYSKLGLKLGFNQHELDNYNRMHPDDAEMCSYRMLLDWARRHEDKGILFYTTLCKACSDIGRQDMVKEVKQLFYPNKSNMCVVS